MVVVRDIFGTLSVPVIMAMSVKKTFVPNFFSSTLLPGRDVCLPRFCGMVKDSDILFQKEGKDHGKSAKDLHRGV